MCDIWTLLLYHSSEVCCHGCSSSPVSDDSLLSSIADSFSSTPSLEGIRVELEFGHVNGTLLRYPTPQPPADCTAENSNLQSVCSSQQLLCHVLHVYAMHKVTIRRFRCAELRLVLCAIHPRISLCKARISAMHFSLQI